MTAPFHRRTKAAGARVTDGTLSTIDAMAAANGQSRTEFVRDAITEKILRAQSECPRCGTEMRVSVTKKSPGIVPAEHEGEHVT